MHTILFYKYKVDYMFCFKLYKEGNQTKNIFINVYDNLYMTNM